MPLEAKMRSIMEATLDKLEPGPCEDVIYSETPTLKLLVVSDATLQSLRHLFPDSLILGALSLLDSNSVCKYILENGRIRYIVHGSNAASYIVHPELGGGRPPFCSCTAFFHGVLSSQSYLLCKHVLALRIAMGMGKLDERPISEDDFVILLSTRKGHD